MVTMLQTASANAFSWMKITVFGLKLHWNLFPMVQITISWQWFRWRQTVDKPLPEPVMAFLLTHICVIRPQWVKHHCIYKSLPIDWYLPHLIPKTTLNQLIDQFCIEYWICIFMSQVFYMAMIHNSSISIQMKVIIDLQWPCWSREKWINSLAPAKCGSDFGYKFQIHCTR